MPEDTQKLLTATQEQAVLAMSAAGMPASSIADALCVPLEVVQPSAAWRVGQIEQLRYAQLEQALFPPQTKYKGAKRKRAFLAALEANGGSITDAAAAAGIERQLHYRWKDEDPEYAAAFDKARERAADVLEDEAVRRAKIGVLEPCYNRAGELVGHKIRFSDQLLLSRLAADRPDRWKTRTELTGKDGGPVEVKSALPEWLLQQLQQQSAGTTIPSPASDPSTQT